MENELILEELPSLVTIGGASTVWAFVPGAVTWCIWCTRPVTLVV